MYRSTTVAFLLSVMAIMVAAQVAAQAPSGAMGPQGMGPQAMGAQNFDDFEVATPEHVAGNIYNVVGAIIVNMGFSVGVDGILMVDSNFEELTDRVLAAIREISDEPIRFLVDTHSHRDHAEGNVSFAELGALIFAHDAVRTRLANPPQGEAADSIALPVVTFADRVSFHFNGEEVEAFHVAAGHTDEDVMVYFKGSDVIHMGDVFVGQYPIIDTSRRGTYPGLLESLNAAIALAGPNTKIIPGHGPIGDRDGMIEFRDMLRDIHDRVSKLKDEGLTLEQVLAANPTADYDNRWAGPRGSQGIVTAAYRSVGTQ